jgi:hypothetical protein
MTYAGHNLVRNPVQAPRHAGSFGRRAAMTPAYPLYWARQMARLASRRRGASVVVSMPVLRGVAHVLVWMTASVALLLLATACAEEAGGNGDGGGAEVQQEEADTGRMSEGEFETFDRYDQEFIGELQDWSIGYATCATIAQTGDLAGFRDCIQEKWKGVEDAGLLAYGNATDTFDDVGKECLSTLRRYRKQVDTVYSRNKAAYDAADALYFEGHRGSVPREFRSLPKFAKRYANASVATRDACRPS